MLKMQKVVRVNRAVSAVGEGGWVLLLVGIWQ